MVDIALALDALVPGAQYRGSLTANTRAAYDALAWSDDRDKPDWSQIEAWSPPVPVPDSITLRQLLIGLRRAKWITPAEADAWSADGTLPSAITAVIDDLPTEDERVDARITARRMSDAYRNDPLLIAAAHAAMPDADEQEISDTLDQAFREWSQL